MQIIVQARGRQIQQLPGMSVCATFAGEQCWIRPKIHLVYSLVPCHCSPDWENPPKAPKRAHRDATDAPVPQEQSGASGKVPTSMKNAVTAPRFFSPESILSMCLNGWPLLAYRQHLVYRGSSPAARNTTSGTRLVNKP